MKTRKRPGQTLIEVSMAAMIAAITTTAVFSVVLSSFVSDSRADKRDAAAMVLRRAQETLKSYVSAQPYNTNMFPGVAPARAGAPGSPVGRWSADPSGFWALRDGLHNISSLVAVPPLTVPGKPPATMSYTVTSSDCGFGFGISPDNERACKTVVFRLSYTD